MPPHGSTVRAFSPATLQGAAFPPPFSLQNLIRPLLTSIVDRQPLRAAHSLLNVDLSCSGEPAPIMRNVIAQQAENLLSRGISFRHFVRENIWLSRGTPRLLSTRNCRIYKMRRIRMVRTSDCVAPSSPCTLPLFACCTSARVFASSFLHPSFTARDSAFRYPSHHPARS